MQLTFLTDSFWAPRYFQVDDIGLLKNRVSWRYKLALENYLGFYILIWTIYLFIETMYDNENKRTKLKFS